MIGATAGEFRHIDAMACASEAQIDPVMPHPFFDQPGADAGLDHQIDRALFKNARSHPVDHVLSAAVFDDDGIDTFEMQQLRQQQASRPCAHNAYLGSELFHSGLNSLNDHGDSLPCADAHRTQSVASTSTL